MLWGENRGKWKGRQSMGTEPRTVTARCATKAHQYHMSNAYRGLWWLVVVRLLWLSGRALAAQTRGILGLTPGDCRLFHFPLFSSHTNLLSPSVLRWSPLFISISLPVPWARSVATGQSKRIVVQVAMACQSGWIREDPKSLWLTRMRKTPAISVHLSPSPPPPSSLLAVLAMYSGSYWVRVQGYCRTSSDGRSLVPRPLPLFSFHHLQYAKQKGEAREI